MKLTHVFYISIVALVLSALSLGISYSYQNHSPNNESKARRLTSVYELPGYKRDRDLYPSPTKPFDLDGSNRVKTTLKPNLDDNPEKIITEALKKIEPGIRIDHINQTESKHLYEVVIAVGSLYITADGKYMFKGDAFDIEKQKVLKALPGKKTIETATPHARTKLKNDLGKEDAIASLSRIQSYVEVVHPTAKEIIEDKIKPRHYITYPRTTKSATNAELVVFTDPTCINCRNFHKKINDFTSYGVTVKYLPYPRGGSGSEGYKLLDSVYCLDNLDARKNAMNNVLRRKSITQSQGCETRIVNSIPKYFKPLIGGGTPRIVTSNGYVIRGNHDVKDIMEVLSLAPAY